MTAGPAAGSPIEGFAVETKDGAVFTVKGFVHPPHRIVAYLRYVPDPAGGRERAGRRYRRVYHFEEQREALQEGWPAHLAYDPMSGVQLQTVLRRDVRLVYDPCLCLQRLLERGPTDPLQETALALTELLGTAAGVPLSALGVTGSLLVDLHNASSDIDIVVYGAEECRAVHGCLTSLLDDPSTPVCRPEGEHLAAIHKAHNMDTPLSLSDFARLQAGKVNEGRFCGRSYFVRFVKRSCEVAERYGDPRYELLGPASIRARVEDHADAMFTPCRYIVGDVTILQGVPTGDVREIVSFRGRFADQAKTGDWVLARGRLERIVSGKMPRSCRLTVGGQPGDYLLS